MAKTRLSGATLVQYGYGQVEDNHLSAPRNGQVYAQLPAAATITVLENGQFVAYDYAKGVCNLPGDSNVGNGPVMMVYNEVKVYEDRQTDADFAMVKDNYAAHIYNAQGAAMPTGTTMVPRVFKLSVGDIFTTNCINSTIGALEVGTKVRAGADGYLVASSATTPAGYGPIMQVVKVYTMPDNQPGVKLQCIAE